MLFLVRHGRPVRVPRVPASRWSLDPAAYDDVRALRPRLPVDAVWYSSPEPKARQTAALLTEATGPEVGIVDDLREHVRDGSWIDDFPGVVRAAFADPDRPAHPGWEPLQACRDRVTAGVRRLRDRHPDDDLVLVGHGTAWTVLVAELSGTEPDLARWETLGFPGLLTLEG